MGVPARSEDLVNRCEATESKGLPVRQGGWGSSPPPAQAIALQRAVGNRAATRVLTRWAAHPDKDKKSVLMPDAMAAEYVRFNPPLSK
jgi:hypothetical protein